MEKSPSPSDFRQAGSAPGDSSPGSPPPPTGLKAAFRGSEDFLPREKLARLGPGALSDAELVERPVEHRKEIARAAAQTAGPPDRRRRTGSEIEDSRQRNDREQQNARQQNNSVDLPIIHLVHKTSKGGRPTGQPPFVSHRRPN